MSKKKVAKAKSREPETGAPAIQEEPELSPTEKAVFQKFADRRNRHSVPPMKVTKKDGKPYIRPDHRSEEIGTILAMDAIGTVSSYFFYGLVKQLANVGCHGQEVTEGDLNFMLSIVEGIGPRDETEAMLAAQMAAIHNATMTAARRLAHVETIPQQDSASNMLNKLARIYAAQVEALKKYRSTGEQSIRVQHVTVNDGGQAIVGDVQAGGGGQGKTGDQPHEPSRSTAESTPLLGHVETLAAALPSSGSEGMDRVPVSRCTRRRAGGQG